jgi:hypothetical protein
MVRVMSGTATGRHLDAFPGHSIANSTAPSVATRSAPEALALPARFRGRAWFDVDLADTIETFSSALRRAARPETVTATAVQVYCRERGIADERMERALLREAFHVISREVLIERLVHAAERGLSGAGRTRGEGLDGETSELVPRGRGRTFTDHYRGTVFREGESMIVRLALGATLESPLAFAPGQQVRARARHAIPVSGTLRVEGSLTPPAGCPPAQIRVHWRVSKGADALDTRAIQSLASPLEQVVACVGAGALARFAEAIPAHLATLARADRGPTFVQIERLLRLGRVSEKTRAYLLFWQRLRDYLLWRVHAEMHRDATCAD